MSVLSSKSLTAAVKERAERAQARVLKAKHELDGANLALSQALPRGDVATIWRAAERTIVAEEEVQHAADELERINVLLEEELQGHTSDTKLGSRSGQGSTSLMSHIKKKNEH
ncbi:MAG: hypothetical protein JWP43_3665 [Ramlibacter sp.]|nr:hypothetical protein [Ramlibacter sp.]